MFGIKVLVEKLDALIASGSLSDLDLARAMGAIESIEKNGVNTVATLGGLPAASNNKGRFFFVTSEQQYVLSNGTTWSIDNVIREASAGIAYGWSFNNNGQTGDNTTSAKSSPVSVVGGFTDWTQVNAGFGHSLGVRANGTAWAWGNNLGGPLGDNTTVNKSSPVSVVGGFADWVQVEASYVSLGIRSNGTAWAWGKGTDGILGNNSTTDMSSPVSVVGGFTDWVQVSTGRVHSLGVRANGTAWGWGANSVRQLGDFTNVAKSSPVSVVGGFTDWIQVSAGLSTVPHSLGLRSNGTAWAWGTGGTGRLGDNTTIAKSSPVSVVGGFTDWTQVSAGGQFSIGLRANGTAWGWGCNQVGRLGDNTTIAKNSPVSVVGGFTSWIQVNAGSYHNHGIVAGKWSE
jgi:alpha-tubulin suppressor-like RCC1 family protein